MESKNYVIRENDVQRAYFCQLQVSNKFRKTMSPQESELVDWIASTFCHHMSETYDRFEECVRAIECRMETVNQQHDQTGPFLVMTWSPVRKWENGFIRIERTSGRHQSILLPVIDYRGCVVLK